MGRKKKMVVVTKVFCYYCDREFDEEHTLLQHQRTKHFNCHVCHKKFSTAGGMVIHVQHVHREQVTKVPYAIEGREATDIEIYGMQGIPPDVLAAYYGEEEDDTLSKMARVEVPTVQLVAGVVPSPLGTYPPQPPFGMPPMYNAAVSLPYNGWQVAPLPLPLPWYPQPPAVSVPPPPGVGYPQQPMFPVQSPLPSPPSPALQSSFVHPPGVPASLHPVSVSQPLFPLVGVNNLPSQSSPSSAPMLPNNISSNPLGSVDAHTANRTSIHTSNVTGGNTNNSHSNASGPNTGGPSIEPPSVIANEAPQLTINEVYLFYDDEAMSMEERRMSLTKYQGNYPAIDRRILESRLAGRVTI